MNLGSYMGNEKRPPRKAASNAYRLEFREVAADKAAFFARIDLNDREFKRLILKFCQQLNVSHLFRGSTGSTP